MLRDKPYAEPSLRALMVDRLGMLPAGGRGIERELSDVEADGEPVKPSLLVDEDP